MHSMERLLSQVSEIEERICYVFSHKEGLILSCVHRSFYNENRGAVKEHNERLEFLGDSVLGLIVADYLYSKLPMEAEGRLSLLRSQIVEAQTCVSFVRKLNLTSFVLLGRGEQMNDGRGRDKILADFFEALIGAIYLDGGLEAARSFFLRHFSYELEDRLKSPVRNFKAELQDYSQRKHQKPPIYKVLKEEGPDHSKIFHVSVAVADVEMGAGKGSTKKEAEQLAAEEALKKLVE